MKYLLLVSHGTMAPGVHSVIKMLLGERPEVLSYSMEDGVSADVFVEALTEVISPITPDDSVIVLGDIVGGSPLTNTLNTLTGKGLLGNTVAFGGLSLPMAIAALMAIDDRMIHGQTVTRWSLEYPCDGIIAVNDVAASNPVLKAAYKGAAPDKKIFVWTMDHF